MGMAKSNVMWRRIIKNLYLLKILLLTLVRHYIPGHRFAINFYKRLTAGEGPIASTKNGKVRGKTGQAYNNDTFYSFQGIPYAKPPLGNLRFKAPQPAESWDGIRDATHEGYDCLSRHSVLKTLIGSEDCLTLNIYTKQLPSDDVKLKLKPVMVWIHGGGFTSGSGSTEAYGPEFLLMEDIVLVSINYRTGMFGFFTLDDPSCGVSGNAGLKDMVLALHWIQENIINFCGDPHNVTIFGESAGGAAIHYLMLSKKTKGLFHKVIMQSACALNVWAIGRNYTPNLIKELGLKSCDDQQVLKILQDMTAEQIYKLAEKLVEEGVFLASQIRTYAPIIEKESPDALITRNPWEILQSGDYNRIPIMIGYTTREGILAEIVQKPKPLTPLTDFEYAIPHFWNIQRGSEVSKLMAEEIKRFYYGDSIPTNTNKDPYYLLETDSFFLRDILEAVKLHKQQSLEPIYLYRISAETNLNILKKIYNVTEPGVCHADDLGYLFKNLLTPEIEPGSDEDIAIHRFVQLWTNFAKYSDPNPKEANALVNVKWQAVEENQMNFLDIGTVLTPLSDPDSDRISFWSNLYNLYVSK